MKVYSANKKGLLILTVIFCFMYILNSMTPLLNEDYFAAFVWPQGVPNLGNLPENTKKVSSLFDVFENVRIYYFTEGGRVPGGFPGTLFSWLGKDYFNPLNALVMTILVMEIYWLSHEGTVSIDFKPSYLIWIFFSLWAFNISFTDACLWMSGSGNYLWMMIIVLAFLIPYVKNYYNPNLLIENKPKMSVVMFFIGILAGWSHETTTCWLVLILFYWLYVCKKRANLQTWKLAGFAGLCIGYSLLMFAPGNFVRLASQQQANSIISFSALYTYKLTEVMWIILFHSLLWHYIISFFYRYKNSQSEVLLPYLNMTKICSTIALASGVFMFVIPSSIVRPSFLNLVFLTIAVTTLFRAQEVVKKSLIQQKVKKILQLFGWTYLLLTIIISLWCNYSNWSRWNDAINMIQHEKKNPTNVVLSVKSYYKYSEIWSPFARGFHLLPFPVVSGDENDNINATLAKYYGIKGIKVVN